MKTKAHLLPPSRREFSIPFSHKTFAIVPQSIISVQLSVKEKAGCMVWATAES